MIRQELEAGLQQSQLICNEEQLASLEQYIVLLHKWNKTYNLTAIREINKMVSHHALDSLSVLPYLGQSERLLDVGSGGGTPGIPVAILRPEIAVTLIDANHKKTAFLRQVKAELRLDNVQVVTDRVEAYQPDILFDCIVSRAFSELNSFVSLTRHLLKKQGGYWLAMKGVYPEAELEQVRQTVVVDNIYPVQVSGVEGERHLIRMVMP